MSGNSSTPELSRSIDALLGDYQVPGAPGAAVAIMEQGRIVFAEGYGLAGIETNDPVSIHTNFRLASVTKQFTAMALLLLAEREQLSLESRLTELLPGFPAYGNAITVRHLLGHTSGLLDYEDLIPPEHTQPLKDRDVLELLQRQERLFFAPGEKFRYSNSGYVLLAQIVEQVSRLSFAEFLRRNIFEPLAMTNTVAHEEGVSTVAHRAYGYTKQAAGFRRTDQSLTSAVLGDGGIYSSVMDLAKWLAALHDGRLVSPALREEAFTPGTLNSGRVTDYGFGWQLNAYRGLSCLSHSGSTIGFRNFVARFPERGFDVIVLTNRSNALSTDVLDSLLEVFQIVDPTTPADRRTAARIVGQTSLDEHQRRD